MEVWNNLPNIIYFAIIEWCYWSHIIYILLRLEPLTYLYISEHCSRGDLIYRHSCYFTSDNKLTFDDAEVTYWFRKQAKIRRWCGNVLGYKTWFNSTMLIYCTSFYNMLQFEDSVVRYWFIKHTPIRRCLNIALVYKTCSNSRILW